MLSYASKKPAQSKPIKTYNPKQSGVLKVSNKKEETVKHFVERRNRKQFGRG